MTDLASRVCKYYIENFSVLPGDKQFHFVSRLSSWTNDDWASSMLCDLKSIMATQTIRSDLMKLIAEPPSAKINAFERREPYFEKYPELRGLMLALFRVRHLLFHYDIDARDILLEIVSKEKLYDLSEQLKVDSAALKILSTYAINYIYLVESILFPGTHDQLVMFASDVLELEKEYTYESEDTLLLIYLFTHCIIGESNFYQRQVVQKVYKDMIRMLEDRIINQYDDINLDNKFEFLVCCKLVGFDSALADRISKEARASVSTNGVYLVDTLNTAAQGNKTSFADSEHRNVLYIMSQTDFQKARIKLV